LAANSARPRSDLPFFLAGGIKLVYDGLIYTAFRNVRPPEEVALLEARQTHRSAASERGADVMNSVRR
jgi:hypothetical protein